MPEDILSATIHSGARSQEVIDEISAKTQQYCQQGRSNMKALEAGDSIENLKNFFEKAQKLWSSVLRTEDKQNFPKFVKEAKDLFNMKEVNDHTFKEKMKELVMYHKKSISLHVNKKQVAHWDHLSNTFLMPLLYFLKQECARTEKYSPPLNKATAIFTTNGALQIAFRCWPTSKNENSTDPVMVLINKEKEIRIPAKSFYSETEYEALLEVKGDGVYFANDTPIEDKIIHVDMRLSLNKLVKLSTLSCLKISRFECGGIDMDTNLVHSECGGIDMDTKLNQLIGKTLTMHYKDTVKDAYFKVDMSEKENIWYDEKGKATKALYCKFYKVHKESGVKVSADNWCKVELKLPYDQLKAAVFDEVKEEVKEDKANEDKANEESDTDFEGNDDDVDPPRDDVAPDDDDSPDWGGVAECSDSYTEDYSDSYTEYEESDDEEKKRIEDEKRMKAEKERENERRRLADKEYEREKEKKRTAEKIRYEDDKRRKVEKECEVKSGSRFEGDVFKFVHYNAVKDMSRIRPRTYVGRAFCWTCGLKSGENHAIAHKNHAKFCRPDGVDPEFHRVKNAYWSRHNRGYNCY